jgi:hypothetical protein
MLFGWQSPQKPRRALRSRRLLGLLARVGLPAPFPLVQPFRGLHLGGYRQQCGPIHIGGGLVASKVQSLRQRAVELSDIGNGGHHELTCNTLFFTGRDYSPGQLCSWRE